jgi:hypothetical protein
MNKIEVLSVVGRSTHETFDKILIQEANGTRDGVISEWQS